MLGTLTMLGSLLLQTFSDNKLGIFEECYFLHYAADTAIHFDPDWYC